MGNCSPRGVTTIEESPNPIRVRTDSGEIIEFNAPKLAKDVVSDYPGFSIYRDGETQGPSGAPVPHCEYLIGGQFYCLVPVKIAALPEPKAVPIGGDDGPMKPKELSSDSKKEAQEQGKGSAALHVLPSHRDGVWKVKLVIDPKRLEEIWSEQENVEALIENMRMVAAAAESFTPRRSRSSWGVSRKAASLSHMLKLPN
ncbi:unnamed protein product [Linum trigynum]|uniref:Uncharacterized protein n=1 Tax=Linum trigynum TaxID=586398 RepID=A0AAV2DJG7_9ROSI